MKYLNISTTWMGFLVWSTWDYLSSWFHCCWPSQTYCFVEFMVCSKSTSKSQQKCGIVWLGSKLLTDIIKYVFQICEDFFKLNYMICKWWELNKCCWQTDKIHSPPACVFVTLQRKRVHSGAGQPSEWMWENRLLITGMTFQYPRSTNSGPWSGFNLFRLEQLDCSPH